MRRHRPTHYSLALITVAAGAATLPSTVGASADPVVPSDSAAQAPQPEAPTPAPPAAEEPAPAPPTTEAPPLPETTEPPEDTEPPATTPPTTPDPEPTPPSDDETPAPPTTTPPPTSQPAPSPVERPTEPSPRDDDELDADVPDALPDVRVVRPIAFPVLGPVSYGNDWGNCRAGCARRHLGTDMIGVRMQPLLAAVDGTVTRVRYENEGTAGTAISITGADGWYYNYFHVNNDTPGTDDGVAGHEWQVAPPLTVGSPVRAGQVIGYMGDSGNAEGSVPHLHFEIRQPDRTPVNPYHSLVAAQGTETCVPTGGLELSDAAALSPAAVAIIPIEGSGRWLIDHDGRLSADGLAARVDPVAGISCEVVQPLVEVEAPVVQAAAPVPAAEVPAAGTGAPDPAAVAATPWTVERGQSLWSISQEAYGVSDVSSTVALVGFVFDYNGDVLVDPNSLDVGTTLQIPALKF